MLEVGQCFEEKRTFAQADFNEFAELSGDDNPIHVDPAFAAKTHFGATVSHGMLLYSCLRGVLLQHIPGARQLTHEMMFPNGTPTGMEVVFRCEVMEVDAGNRQALLAVKVIQPDGDLGLDGQTRIQWPEAQA